MTLWLSPQWVCGNSCTWAQDVLLYISGTNEPKSGQQVRQGAKYKKSQVIHDRHRECSNITEARWV